MGNDLHTKYKKRYTILDSMTVYNVGVDAGLIVISDLDWFKKKKGYKLDKDVSSIHNIEPGKYHIDWSIEETWNGPVSGDGILEVTSGKVVVSDPCYLISNDDHKDWMNILEETEYFQKPPEGMIVLDKMGGDGCYNVDIKFKKLRIKLHV